jgi:hypothetical protein
VARLSLVLESLWAEWATGSKDQVVLICTVSNTLLRHLNSIGLERRMKDVSIDLKSYLASKEAEPDA